MPLFVFKGEKHDQKTNSSLWKNWALVCKNNQEKIRISGGKIAKEKLTKKQLQKFIQGFFAEKVKGQEKIALRKQGDMSL